LQPFVVDLHRTSAEQRIVEASTALEVARKKLTEAEEAAASEEMSLEETRLRFTIAEKSLAAAEAQSASIKARAAADRARHQGPPGEQVARAIADAARAERIAVATKADEDLSRAELDVLRAATDKKEGADKKRSAARAALETARKASDRQGEEYTPLPGALKTLESNLETEASRRKPFPATSTGRRSALAKWMTDPRNPLTARVAVNHLWARHFGKPLVPTVFDFGRKGTPPSHPELLDWLAVELIDQGSSMKAIHRLIVTSNTYRLTSTSAGAPDETRAGDPDNRFYWRANPIRIEAQLVRDSLLYLAGELDLRQGGPPVPVNEETSRRRSLHFVHSHNEHQKFLATFDDASVLECYRREESIVPQQALALENSRLATEMAEKIAQRIAAAQPSASEQDFIRAAFLRVLAIEPSRSEVATARDALARLTEAARRRNRRNPEAQARTYLVQALLNHSDFVTIR
jgi:hypothetical protein